MAPAPIGIFHGGSASPGPLCGRGLAMCGDIWCHLPEGHKGDCSPDRAEEIGTVTIAIEPDTRAIRADTADIRDSLAAKVATSQPCRELILARMFRRHLTQAAGAMDALACSRSIYDPRRWHANFLAWYLRRMRRHASAAAEWSAR